MDILISCYEKDGDELIKSVALDLNKINEIKLIMHIPDNEDMYGFYPIRRSHIEKLQVLCSEKIDIDEFDCFLECAD